MIFIDYNSLPKDDELRDKYLQNYFPDRIVTSELVNDKWLLKIEFPDKLDYFIDNRISSGLNWWKSSLSITDIYKSYKRFDKNKYQISLSDAWTLYSWSLWLTKSAKKGIYPSEIVILHVDDHNDLMSPRIFRHNNLWYDAISNDKFDLLNPESVECSINTGAISMGSFILPLLLKIPKVQIRHLCNTNYLENRPSRSSIDVEYEKDSLLKPNNCRPSIILSNISKNSHSSHEYCLTDDINEWIDTPYDCPILLHIDFDYFNNRFNGDSDWDKYQMLNNSSFNDIINRIDKIFLGLKNSKIKKRIVDITLAISPGFFPAEFWELTTSKIDSHINSLEL